MTSKFIMKGPKKLYLNEQGIVVRVETINSEESLTDQQWKEETDVNNIIRKYQTTGQITHLNSVKGVYADISEVGDYHSTLNKILKAQDAFDSLSSDIRNRFNNDPGQLLKFLDDPSNKEEGIKLGLLQNNEYAEQKPNDLNEQKQTAKNVKTKTPSTSSTITPSTGSTDQNDL